MEVDMGQEPAAAGIGERLAALRGGLKRQSRALAAFEKALGTLIQRNERLHKAPREVLEALEAVRAAIEGQEATEDPGDLMDEIEQEAKASLDEARRRFGTELAAALKEKLDDRHELRPLEESYEYGTVRIVTEESSGHTRLEYARVPVVKKLGSDPEAVATAIAKLFEDLESADFDPGVFLEQCLAAYHHTASSQGRQLGESVDILLFWSSLVLERQSSSFRRTPTQRSFKDYPIYRFVYDLCRLRAARRFEVDGRKLELEMAVHDRAYGKSIWIPAERSGGSFYQGIAFREAR